MLDTREIVARTTAVAEEATRRRRIPGATYRLQFGRDFTFNDARRIVPYLAELGITDCYASPIFKSRAGSHGYDICDHRSLDPDAGTEDDLAALAETLHAHGMGMIIDVVPNHMGIGGDCNPWWLDVLEHGPSSPYAEFFDIDWNPATSELENKLLLPILEDQYGVVLESGKLQLAYRDGAFVIEHYDDFLPVAPETYDAIVGHRVDDVVERLGEDDEHVQELQSILTALHHLPPRTERDPERIQEGRRESEVIKRRLVTLYDNCLEVRAAIDDTVREFNGTPGVSGSFDQLDALLDRQAYRPAYWRVASEEINYRRFFDINELAAIRVERPDVFRATHELAFRLIREGKVNGLRVDHPDGLLAPTEYFRKLQEQYLAQVAQDEIDAPDQDDEIADAAVRWFQDGHAPGDAKTLEPPLYVVAEKILSERETLEPEWPVFGTTGYDFLASANGLFVDAKARRVFDRIYGQFIGRNIDFGELVNASKKMIMLVSFSSEINTLGHQLDQLTAANRCYRDFTRNSLIFAIREIIASLAVYRTYLSKPGQALPRDQRYVEQAVADAKRRNPRTSESLFDFIRDTLMMRNLEEFPEEDRHKLIDFVLKFQQVTGPVMAKGVEDTAFYVYNRLVSLNEVGGHPGHFGTSVAAFHSMNSHRDSHWPYSMLAGSTHDTKRSEDVRARINVLSEMPMEWRAALSRWSRMNAKKKTKVDGEPAPDRNDEYLLYQTLIGAWPDGDAAEVDLSEFRTRIQAYMLKATKEAKVHTSWVNANEEYDGATEGFVAALLADGDNPFLDDFRMFQERVGFFGRFNSLSQLLLRLTSPGIPDTYQGTELWDLSLVDPDNRRAVDYERRRIALGDLAARIAQGDLPRLCADLLANAHDGRIKLYVLQRGLQTRAENEGLFTIGDYTPLAAAGDQAEHIVAFKRRLGEREAVVVAPRLMFELRDGLEDAPTGAIWGETVLLLPDGDGARYRDMFTGEQVAVERVDGEAGIPLARVLGAFPLALLLRE